MRFILIQSFVATLVLAVLCSPEALAQQKKVEIVKKWSGSVADENLVKTAPEVITGKKKLESIWKAWKIEGDMPTIDFTKLVLVVAHSPGSRIDMSTARLDENGNLAAVGFGTRDIAPGFRYVFAAVSREGVVTVNGKKLPSDD